MHSPSYSFNTVPNSQRFYHSCWSGEENERWETKEISPGPCITLMRDSLPLIVTPYSVSLFFSFMKIAFSIFPCQEGKFFFIYSALGHLVMEEAGIEPRWDGGGIGIFDQWRKGVEKLLFRSPTLFCQLQNMENVSSLITTRRPALISQFLALSHSCWSGVENEKLKNERLMKLLHSPCMSLMRESLPFILASYPVSLFLLVRN